MQNLQVLELLESSNDVFYGLDADWRFTYLNRRAEALWGRTREQLIGRNIWDEFPQGVQTQAYEEMHRALAEQRTIHFETFSSFLASWVDVEVYPTASGLGVYFHDIAERKRNEAMQAHFTALVQSSNDAIISKTLEGIITSWNPAAERIFGYSAQEVIGQPITPLVPPERRAEEKHFLQAIADGETVQNYDTVRLKKDGSPMDVSVTLSPITDGQGRIVAASKIVRDITERKQAEDAQRRYAERLAAINRLDRTIASNVNILQVYENFVAELRTLVPVDRTSIVRLNEARDQWAIIRQWTQQQPAFSPGLWMPVQGSVIEWLVTNRVPFFEAEIGERGDWPETAILRREGIHSRLLLPLIIEDRVIGLLTVASRQPNAFSEAIQSILATIADQLSIAIQKSDLYDQVQRHAAELEQRVRVRTAELEASNKELEAFTYSISHDLRAPLRAIDGFSRMLVRDYQALLPEEGQRRLQVVRDNALQMGQLIDDLLAFSRLNRQPLNRQPLDLTAMVKQVLEELRAEGENHPAELVINPLPPCQADPALLKQVMVNLLSNALKFTRKRPEAHIEVGYDERNGETIYFVRDNGAGFDMRYADKLFGVFQRLHRADEFEGTGVGLAIVQRIIHRHDGRIWAEAEVNQGATFYFTLGQGG